MYTRYLSVATLVLMTAASAALTGCSDDGNKTTGQSSSSSGSGGKGGSGGEGGSGGSGGSAGAGGMGNTAPETVVGFDPTKFEFVEGLDYRNGTAYVGAVTGAIFSVDVAAKTVKPFGSTPPFQPMDGVLVGLTLGPDNLLYAALNSFGPALQGGIYRFAMAGGMATLFASDPAIKFANDIRFDAAGDLFVSDSYAGTIFKISKDGSTVTPWVSHPLLQPDPTVCNVMTNFHLGINGIVRKGDAFYATNTDKASVVKIPVNADGSAGTPEIFLATDCAMFSGADGIVIDPDTNDLLVAINYQNKIIRVKDDKTISVVAQGAPLSSPATLVIDKERDALLVTSAAFESFADPSKAKPALVSVPLP